MAREGSEPNTGEEEKPDDSVLGLRGGSRGKGEMRTDGVQLSLHVLYKVPHLLTTFRILKTERIVDPVRFGPNNQGVCRAT